MEKNYLFDENISVEGRIRNAIERKYRLANEDNGRIYHQNFSEIMGKLMFFGEDTSIFIVGPESSGKNVLIDQAAEVLGLEEKVYRYQLSSTYQEMLENFYEPYTNGGLIVVDKADLMNPNDFFAVASLPTTKSINFKGREVQKSPNFRLVFISYDKDSSIDALSRFTSNAERKEQLLRSSLIFEWAQEHCNVVSIQADPEIKKKVETAKENKKVKEKKMTNA